MRYAAPGTVRSDERPPVATDIAPSPGAAARISSQTRTRISPRLWPAPLIESVDPTHPYVRAYWSAIGRHECSGRSDADDRGGQPNYVAPTSPVYPCPHPRRAGAPLPGAYVRACDDPSARTEATGPAVPPAETSPSASTWQGHCAILDRIRTCRSTPPRHLLHSARRILVFTGAGVSTESGIPDFRGPDGIWTKVDPK